MSADDCLSPESFTLVSADNTDFLHSFAQVFKGNKNASWHGTSVQIVQPLPGLSNTIDYEREDTDCDTYMDPPDHHGLHSGAANGTHMDPPGGTTHGTHMDPPSLHSGVSQDPPKDPPSLHSGISQDPPMDPPSLHSGISQDGLFLQ